MVTTSDDSLAEKIRRLRDHGAAMSDLQRHLGPRPYLLADHPAAGYNQRMTDLQGTLGSVQMDRAREIVAERKAIAKKYDLAFADLEWLQTPPSTQAFCHGYQSYPCMFSPEEIEVSSVEAVNSKRNAWMDELQKKGVSTRPATHAVHMLSYYKISTYLGKDKSNFLNSLLINIVYLALIVPGLYFMDNPSFSRYWFFTLLLIYIVIYLRLYRLTKN